MKDLELQGDLRDEYLANQEAETAAEPKLATDAEITQLLVELWEEIVPSEPEEEYTERDAFDDFYNDYANEMEG